MCAQVVFVACPLRKSTLVYARILPSWGVLVTSQTARRLGASCLTSLPGFTIAKVLCDIRGLHAYDVNPLQVPLPSVLHLGPVDCVSSLGIPLGGAAEASHHPHGMEQDSPYC